MRISSLVRLAILACLWGSSFLWIAVALRSLSPVQIVLVRLALGAAVLLVVVWRRQRKLPTGANIWAHLTVAALFANAIPYTLFGISEQHIASSVAGALNATTPVWTVLFGFVIGHDRRISRARLAGFVIGFLGVLLIFSPWRDSSQIASWGGAAALLAAASYAASYIYMDRYLARRGIEPLVLSASQLLAATGLLLMTTPFAGLQVPHLRWDAVAAVTILGTLGTGAAYVLNYRLITDEGTTASVVTYLLPVVAVILGATVLAEPLTAQVIAGVIVVLAGVALTRRGADIPRERTAAEGTSSRSQASAAPRWPSAKRRA